MPGPASYAGFGQPWIAIEYLQLRAGKEISGIPRPKWKQLPEQRLETNLARQRCFASISVFRSIQNCRYYFGIKERWLTIHPQVERKRAWNGVYLIEIKHICALIQHEVDA